jgi:hypothetical protein
VVTIAGSITIVVAAASDDVAVAGVQFLLDGVNLGSEDTAAPFQVVWNSGTVANGPHVIAAVARDAAGNTQTGAAVTVTVDNDGTAPAVAVTNRKAARRSPGCSCSAPTHRTTSVSPACSSWSTA